MGYMIDGQWYAEFDRAHEAAEAGIDLDEDDDGSYDREETSFREWLGDDFPAEPDRYHLYVSYACPWAHRTLLARALLGLEESISVDIVDPIRIDDGWEFSPEKDGCTPDTVNGFDYLRQAYAAADPNFTGRVTVPVLWDKQEGTIVNNESEEIIKMLAASMGEYGRRDIDLYPADRRDEIDAVIEDIFPSINDGVYRAGFARSQDAYDEAVTALFDALERWNGLLGEQRYLAGEELSLADVCMFTTLYRFDEVYHTHFKCNHRRITDYEHLWGYLRELYGLPGVAETCRMDHIKEHYYRTHPEVNPRRLVPLGPDPNFEAPHDRDHLPGGPPEALAPAAD